MKLPLIAILVIFLQPSKNKYNYELPNGLSSWELISFSENFASYKYHISEPDRIYLAQKSNCYKNGWVLCNFLISSDVKLFKNGVAIFKHNKYISDFPVDTSDVELKWKIKKGKLEFDKSVSIASLQDSLFFNWLTE